MARNGLKSAGHRLHGADGATMAALVIERLPGVGQLLHRLGLQSCPGMWPLRRCSAGLKGHGRAHTSLLPQRLLAMTTKFHDVVRAKCDRYLVVGPDAVNMR